MADGLQVDLACEPRSARLARQELERFRGSLSETRFGDLQLLVSELVADATGGLGSGPKQTVRLSAEGDEDRVRAAVRVGAGAYSLSSTPPEPGEIGWGPYLVVRLSDYWGLRRGRDGATVWFEISSQSTQG